MAWIFRPVSRVFDGALAGVTAAYPPALRWALGSRGLVLAIALAAFAGSLFLIPILGVDLIPSFSQGEFSFDIRLPEGTPIEATDRFLGEVPSVLEGDARVASYSSIAGGAGLSLTSTGTEGENSGRIQVRMKQGATREEEKAVAALLRERLEASGLARFKFGRPSYFTFRTPIEAEIYGDDLAALHTAARDLKGRMEEVPGLVDVKSTSELGNPELQVTFNRGAFQSVEQIAELPIDGRGLRLGDIAEITYEEPPIPYGRHLDGRYAVAVNVFKESTANTVEVVHAVNKVIKEDIGSDPLLQGIKLFVWDDQAEQITSGIEGLTSSGMIGGLLAILVLYFFLRRLDSTIIVSLSIPFSVIAACGMMYFFGKSLNILSMMGLMLGVGMLVDNAIVVLESIDRRHREERNTKKAVLEGAGHVAMAVFASTCTTLIVFLPLIQRR